MEGVSPNLRESIIAQRLTGAVSRREQCLERPPLSAHVSQINGDFHEKMPGLARSIAATFITPSGSHHNRQPEQSLYNTTQLLLRSKNTGEDLHRGSVKLGSQPDNLTTHPTGCCTSRIICGPSSSYTLCIKVARFELEF